MKLTHDDLNLFSALIENNSISVKDAIDWGYSQYTNEGAPNWLENFVLSGDKFELLDILKNEFNVYGELTLEQQIGEVIHRYLTNRINLHQAINELLYDVYPYDDATKKEKSELYIADDFFDWHETPEKEALKTISFIFDKYYPKFAESYNNFITVDQ